MANVMDALSDYCSQYWEVFVEYFCVVFEKMNQIVSPLFSVSLIVTMTCPLSHQWLRFMTTRLSTSYLSS